MVEGEGGGHAASVGVLRSELVRVHRAVDDPQAVVDELVGPVRRVLHAGQPVLRLVDAAWQRLGVDHGEARHGNVGAPSSVASFAFPRLRRPRFIATARPGQPAHDQDVLGVARGGADDVAAVVRA